jgi:DNA polymerase III epsilon subunit-like protein
MIIVDVETTGIDEIKHAILSVGAIDSDNPDNQFYEECRAWDGAHIDSEALNINGFSREQTSDEKKQTDKELIEHFITWSKTISDQTLAGQNPSFDRDFLHRAADRYHIEWPFAFRTIDQHSVCFTHMIKRGLIPPKIKNHSGLNSDTIMQYVGIPTEPHPHNALNGAKVAAEALSRLFYNKQLLPEFKKYPIPWPANKSE